MQSATIHQPFIQFPKQKRLYSLDCEFFEEGNYDRDLYAKSATIPWNQLTEEATSHHNNIEYHEWHRCRQCPNLLFPTQHFLDVHITENHDPFFSLKSAKANMYKCIIPICDQVFSTPGQRFNHLHNVHQVPVNYQLHFKKFKSKKQLQHQQKKTAATEEMMTDHDHL